MDVSMDTDFDNREIKKISFSKRGLTEVEDGELVEDSNINNVTEEEKKILRAKRFGAVDHVSNSKPQDPKIQRLYRRMKVNNETRLEALHLHGTDRMNTEDVFSLFSDCLPASIEWLTDKTCNVVWLDQESCAKAVLQCTIRIKGQNPNESDDSEGESINKEDIRCAIPPGGVWRRGPSSQLAPNLLVRFATYSDRRGNRPHTQQHDPFGRNIVFLDEGDEVAKKFRPDSGNPWVDIAKEWSYYEMRSAAKKHDDRLPVRDARELLSKTDRLLPVKILKAKRSSVDYDIEEDIKVPSKSIISGRKMQADIEEKKILSRKLRSSKSSGLSNIDLRQRLSRKRSRRDDRDDEESVDDDVEDNYHHVSHKRKRYDEVEWRQNDSEESENDEEMPLQSASKDLRSKLKKSTTRSRGHSRSRRKRKHEDDDDEGEEKEVEEEEEEEVEKRKQQKSVVVTKSRKKFVPDCPLQIEIDNDIYFKRVNRNK